MPTNKKTLNQRRPTPRGSEHDDTASVKAYLAALKHPLKSVVQSVRRAILAADRSITEGIKWNSASFYCHGWFATADVRTKHGVMVVFHHGAKAQGDSTVRATIDDPTNLLKWLAKDRAVVAFADDAAFRAKKKAFADIIKQWAAYQTDRANVALMDNDGSSAK